MHGQSPSLTETFPADRTLKRLVFRVDELVVPQMVLPPKRLATDITGKRPLISVRPLMDQEVVGFGELSLAVLADVLLLQSFGKGCLWLLRFGGFCYNRQFVFLLLLLLIKLKLFFGQQGLAKVS